MSLAAMVLADRIGRFMRYYDWWIGLVTFGRDQIVRRAVLERVHAGDRLLDVGCGTGTLAVAAARKGVQVVGVDRSRRMLALARDKAARAGVSIDLRDGRAPILAGQRETFDVATAKFVLSELSSEEATLTVRAMAESLRPGGRLIIADEGVPQHPLLWLLSSLQRLFLALVAFALLQELAPTRRHRWHEMLREAGLVVQKEVLYQGGALRFMVATRLPELPRLHRQTRPLAAVMPSGISRAILRVAAWFALPIPIPAGVHSIGAPGKNAAVLLSGNFLGTVEALRRALLGFDCYVIAEDTSGWNVWCASDAGFFTAEKAAALIDLYGIEDLVAGRTIIIPRLGGRIRERLAELSGWDVITGPVEARDLPDFLQEREVTPAMRSLDRMYRLRERMRVGALTVVQLPVWLLPLRFLPATHRAPVWRFGLAASWVLPLCHYLLPGRTGVVKGGALGLGASTMMLLGKPRRWGPALAVLLSGPFIGWIYQSTSPVIYWKQIWK